MAWHQAEECSQRLAQIPGVGPIGASLLVMKTLAPETFRSARHFAAWLGLTPKNHSTAGRVKLGVITRAGDEALAQRAGGRGYCCHPACPTRPRRRLTLACRPTQAQAAETRFRGASEQNRAHRLEAYGERRDLQSEACAASLGAHRIVIGQTGGTSLLLPC